MNASKNDNDTRKVFVGGLSWESTADDLKRYFERFGPVLDANLKTDLTTGRSRGFGFVLFEDEATVDRVIADRNHVLHGKQIDPKRVVPGGTTGGAGRKIFVGGLDPNLTEQDVMQHFSQYGKVEQVELPFDKVKNQRRAFGFVTFESEDVVKEICANEKVPYGDKMVDIRKVVSKDQLNGGGRGGRGGGAGRGRGAPAMPSPYGPPGGGYDYNGGVYPGGYPGYDYYGQPGYGPPMGYPGAGYAAQGWPGYDQTGQAAAYGQPAPVAPAGPPAAAYGGYDYSGGWQGAADASAYGKVAKRGGGGGAAPAAQPGGYHPYSR